MVAVAAMVTSVAALGDEADYRQAAEYQIKAGFLYSLLVAWP